MNPIQLALLQPYGIQRHIINNLRQYNVVGGGRQAGKYVLAECVVLWAALWGGKCLWVAPTLHMVRANFSKFSRFVGQDSRIGYTENFYRFPDKSDNCFIFEGGGEVDFFGEYELAFSPDQFNPLRGRRYHLALFDEAAFMHKLPLVMDNVMPCLVPDGQAIFISTPSGINPNVFRQLALNSQTDDRWATFRMPTSANPLMTPDRLQEIRRNMSEEMWLEQCEVEFID